MQETERISGVTGIAERKQEIFVAAEKADLLAEMDKRLQELKQQGHTLVRRKEITGRQALRIAINQALYGNDRLLTKIKQLRHHRGGHR